MANLNAKYCPMKAVTGAPSCYEGNCAWWDGKEKQCVIKTIAQELHITEFEIK